MKPSPQKTSNRWPARGYLFLALAFSFSTLIFVLFNFAARAGEEAGTTSPQAPDALQLQLAPYASGLNQPIGITSNGDYRLFVLEQDGIIKIVQPDGSLDPTPFLDIRGRVNSSATETGLLGLTFHPDYWDNGTFYLNYTNMITETRRTRISRFEVTADPDVADPNSEEILLTVIQPAGNHNAGRIMFGPDGFLYIPLGDGGSGGSANAQDMTTVLGKVLRIDVDSTAGSPADCEGSGTGNYTIPSDNPLIDGPGGDCDEIWASGLRNPWQSSFDSLTGDLYIGDVGQNTWEEIDFQPAGSPGGENYGWPCYEADAEYNLSGCGPKGSYTFPIFSYEQDGNGCSVTGGFVYRGSQYPAMFGHYMLTDFCSGNFWDLVPDGGSGWNSTKHTNLASSFSYAAFGEGCDRELYVANRGNGQIYHLQGYYNLSPAITSASPQIQAPYKVTADSLLYLPFIIGEGSLCRPTG
ncbi:MAG: PQQ-dependent sugar dehydrogenase [Chloroflexota bacterium]